MQRVEGEAQLQRVVGISGATVPSSGCVLNMASHPCLWSCWERPVRGGKEVSEHSEDSGQTSLWDMPPEQVWKG